MTQLGSGAIDRMQRILKTHLLKWLDPVELRYRIRERLIVEKMQRIFPLVHPLYYFVPFNYRITGFRCLQLDTLFRRQRKIIRNIHNVDDAVGEQLPSLVVLQKRNIKDGIIRQAGKMELDKTAVELVLDTIIRKRRHRYRSQIFECLSDLVLSVGHPFIDDVSDVGYSEKLFNIDVALTNVFAVHRDYIRAAHTRSGSLRNDLLKGYVVIVIFFNGDRRFYFEYFELAGRFVGDNNVAARRKIGGLKRPLEVDRIFVIRLKPRQLSDKLFDRIALLSEMLMFKRNLSRDHQRLMMFEPEFGRAFQIAQIARLSQSKIHFPFGLHFSLVPVRVILRLS